MNTAPIEFMAWNKEKSIICYSNEDDDKSYWDGVCMSTLDLINSRLNINYKYEFMQLTALRSINDEPIYNHMIVKNKIGLYRVVNMFDYRLMYALSYSEIEIVGNRFQNPELLELCK